MGAPQPARREGTGRRLRHDMDMDVDMDMDMGIGVWGFVDLRRCRAAAHTISGCLRMRGTFDRLGPSTFIPRPSSSAVSSRSAALTALGSWKPASPESFVLR